MGGHVKRAVILAVVLGLSLPVVWLLGACLQGTTQGAGLATVVTPEEAFDAQGATLSRENDKFAKVRIVRLRNNFVPNPDGTVLDGLRFDGICIQEECALVVQLSGVSDLTTQLAILHLVVDGQVLADLRGKTSLRMSGYAVEGSLVVVLDHETMRGIIAAKTVEYRVEKDGVQANVVDPEGPHGRYEGSLSPENILNLRELLTMSGVDTWEEVEEDTPRGPRVNEAVGAPPTDEPKTPDTMSVPDE